ncbi:MAG: hypothetical protein Q9226_004822 [Calogaya cf. arnoldii]
MSFQPKDLAILEELDANALREAYQELAAEYQIATKERDAANKTLLGEHESDKEKAEQKLRDLEIASKTTDLKADSRSEFEAESGQAQSKIAELGSALEKKTSEFKIVQSKLEESQPTLQDLADTLSVSVADLQEKGTLVPKADKNTLDADK